MAIAWPQEHGRLSGQRCKAITREVNDLCNELRGSAGGLVDAFGIPDAVLRAPIGVRGAGLGRMPRRAVKHHDLGAELDAAALDREQRRQPAPRRQQTPAERVQRDADRLTLAAR
jgi:hypothetical protein